MKYFILHSSRRPSNETELFMRPEVMVKYEVKILFTSVLRELNPAITKDHYVHWGMWVLITDAANVADHLAGYSSNKLWDFSSLYATLPLLELQNLSLEQSTESCLSISFQWDFGNTFTAHHANKVWQKGGDDPSEIRFPLHLGFDPLYPSVISLTS